MMEVSRNYVPKNNFLNLIRKECTKKKIILIFDECSSGFRETLGGLHLKYKVNPDLAMFGKALGNGYPITAVIGKSRFTILAIVEAQPAVALTTKSVLILPWFVITPVTELL